MVLVCARRCLICCRVVFFFFLGLSIFIRSCTCDVDLWDIVILQNVVKRKKYNNYARSYNLEVDGSYSCVRFPLRLGMFFGFGLSIYCEWSSVYFICVAYFLFFFSHYLV